VGLLSSPADSSRVFFINLLYEIFMNRLGHSYVRNCQMDSCGKVLESASGAE
jgi:hypothetical protein